MSRAENKEDDLRSRAWMRACVSDMHVADHHTIYWRDTSGRAGRMLALFSIYY